MIKKLVPPVMALAIIGGAGLSLIKSSEGLRPIAYMDPANIPTICYGHTGPEVKVGQRVSLEYCEAILSQDIASHQLAIIGPANCIRSAPLTQNQLDALTSFTFNVGTGKFCTSTMATKLVARDYQGAANEFPKWSKSRINGKLVTLPGLAKRRTAEKILFLTAGPAAGVRPSTGALRALTGISTAQGKY